MSSERKNQKQRTRDGLVEAAVKLLRAGRSPTVSDVATAALVSPATAYRYFPSAQSLWQAVLHAIGEPSKQEVFAGLERADAETRVAAMIAQVSGRMLENETVWRTAHAARSEPGEGGPRRAAKNEHGSRIPAHTGQRLRWIDEALAPAERSFNAASYRRLRSALALVIGADPMITLRDLCGLTAEDARELSVWAARALVRAASRDAQAPGKRAVRTTSKKAAKRSR